MAAGILGVTTSALDINILFILSELNSTLQYYLHFEQQLVVIEAHD